MPRSLQTAANGMALAAFSLGLVTSCAAPVTVPYTGVPASPKILMIGDSLTVGPFGDRMESWLVHTFGASKVAIYASCGSSPEHWLASEKVFVTPCGYRESHSGKRTLEKHRNGRRPRSVPTPKIEALLAKHRPEIVIVQLGTNHYDNLAKEGRKCLPELARYYERFAAALMNGRTSVRIVVWITPPDSSKFPNWIEDEIEDLIVATVKRHDYGKIFSRKITRYVPGKTGSDGVHYNDKAGTDWANRVINGLHTGFSKIGLVR